MQQYGVALWRTENVKEEEQRERAKWIKFPPDPEPIHGRTCQVCGGKLVLVMLNYHWDRGTDVTTPADTEETCLRIAASKRIHMHCLVALLLALQSATVIDVQGNHEVTLALRA